MAVKTRIILADRAGIAAAAERLCAGDIVALPTETVYGLAARAADGDAVAKIYAAKQRPAINPLIVHVADTRAAAELVVIDSLSAALMAAFWPGGLTLVLPLRAGAPVAALVTAGLSTLAVRCPAHPVMQALIAAAGPLAAPSANASGRISATRAPHVASSLAGRLELILDGGAGASAIGIESTIVMAVPAANTVHLLRVGAIPLPAIAAVVAGLGARIVTGSGTGLVAPGMLASHYAPRQPLRLAATTARPGEYLLGFGAVAGDANLSAAGDPVEAAARLFDLLHAAEASGKPGIAVAPIPEDGLGAAINDRLRRAAAPRG